MMMHDDDTAPEDAKQRLDSLWKWARRWTGSWGLGGKNPKPIHVAGHTVYATFYGIFDFYRELPDGEKKRKCKNSDLRLATATATGVMERPEALRKKDLEGHLVGKTCYFCSPNIALGGERFNDRPNVIGIITTRQGAIDIKKYISTAYIEDGNYKQRILGHTGWPKNEWEFPEDRTHVYFAVRGALSDLTLFLRSITREKCAVAGTPTQWDHRGGNHTVTVRGRPMPYPRPFMPSDFRQLWAACENVINVASLLRTVLRDRSTVVEPEVVEQEGVEQEDVEQEVVEPEVVEPEVVEPAVVSDSDWPERLDILALAQEFAVDRERRAKDISIIPIENRTSRFKWGRRGTTVSEDDISVALLLVEAAMFVKGRRQFMVGVRDIIGLRVAMGLRHNHPKSLLARDLLEHYEIIQPLDGTYRFGSEPRTERFCVSRRSSLFGRVKATALIWDSRCKVLEEGKRRGLAKNSPHIWR
jgi:hypothetical protein